MASRVAGSAWGLNATLDSAFGDRAKMARCRRPPARLPVLPSDEDGWPEPIKDVVGHFCYDCDVEPVMARPFGWRRAQDDRYGRVLTEIAGAMVQRLRGIKAEIEQRRKRQSSAVRLAADDGQVIYLHARENDADAWQRVGDALVERNFVVFPNEPEPIVRKPAAIREIADRRIETMSGCDALLLLGTADGRALDADLVVVGRHDRNSARARTDRLLPCGVLDTAGGVIATPRRKVTARALGIDWIDTACKVWPNDVKKWLNEASAVMERA